MLTQAEEQMSASQHVHFMRWKHKLPAETLKAAAEPGPPGRACRSCLCSARDSQTDRFRLAGSGCCAITWVAEYEPAKIKVIFWHCPTRCSFQSTQHPTAAGPTSLATHRAPRLKNDALKRSRLTSTSECQRLLALNLALHSD